MSKVKMISIDLHSWLLSCLCKDIYPQEIDDRWIHVADWFLMASGIEEVSLNTFKFDDSVYFDSGVFSFEATRSNMLTDMAKQLTIFNFIWGGLEALIDIIIPKDEIDCHGKINATCSYLKKGYSSETIHGYINMVDELLKIFKLTGYCNDTLNLGDLHNTYFYKSHVNKTGIGLFLVYKIRNKFAHGAAGFPIPLDNDEDTSEGFYTYIIRLSSRIVLLSTQMLLSVYFKDKNFDVGQIYLNSWFTLEDMHILSILEKLHLDLKEV